MREKNVQKIRQKVVEDYDNIAKEFDSTRKTEWEAFELVLPYIENNDYVVDLGCGNGRILEFLEKHRKIKYLGIDNSLGLLEAAKKNHSGAQFIHGDMLALPLEPSSVDKALAIASLHHIPSEKLREKAVQETYRILKENGLYILTVWNLFQPKYKKYIWKSRLKWLVTFGSYDSRDTFIPWGKSGIKRYYYAFKLNELKSLLENNGFEIIKTHVDNNFVLICKKI
ncbi:MAG: methyltransferase domain-containing protein [Candidatus Gracilibacteria bacterium]|jgi:ubiquinone/menaquinone biosynthesis C-methylase UbiE